jgi:predicted O-linked N-acetylglucosamine transferase (SPINDLY family)
MGLRPAPIQINSIGFPGTLGADWYDYILVDHFGAPEAMQPFYTERLWHMPHASYPSDTTRAPQRTAPSRAECGLPEQGFVFCCFNKSAKILPAVFSIWMRLLHAVPGSVLWLLASDAEATANLQREAAAAGVDPSRLVFAPKVPQQQHLARHAAADLFIDTFPYGAHTTTNDALLVGLPLLTCAGETLVTRLAGSQLNAIGLPELVTGDFAEYEALALRLAREPQTLAGFRARLAANRATHPLFDMARYTRDFEDGVQAIWRDFQVQQTRMPSD